MLGYWVEREKRGAPKVKDAFLVVNLNVYFQQCGEMVAGSLCILRRERGMAADPRRDYLWLSSRL